MREAPSVEEAANKFAGQVDLIGVAWSGDDDSYARFIERHGVTFPQIQDDPGEVFARFGVSFQPALVIVQPDGSTEMIAGAVDETLLEQILSEA